VREDFELTDFVVRKISLGCNSEQKRIIYNYVMQYLTSIKLYNSKDKFLRSFCLTEAKKALRFLLRLKLLYRFRLHKLYLSFKLYENRRIESKK